MSAIEVRGLERSFGATRVLWRLELRVERGEHIAITGSNGSGKTTLLRILAGLLSPTYGDVAVLGGTTDDPAVRRRVGVIGHASSLYPRMTALENMRFWGRLYESAHAVDRARELLSAVAIDPDDRRPVGAYSHGMRQRAAVVRAICIGPDVVIADEPVAGLDGAGAAAVASLLSRCNTVVLATHDARATQATRCLELVDGGLR